MRDSQNEPHVRLHAAARAASYVHRVCPASPGPKVARRGRLGDLLHCRISIRPLTAVGHLRRTKAGSNFVQRPLRGALDQEGATVERLAQRLGMGSRQLTRLFARHL
jgi:AraC-like DNA-binding protein